MFRLFPFIHQIYLLYLHSDCLFFLYESSCFKSCPPLDFLPFWKSIKHLSLKNPVVSIHLTTALRGRWVEVRAWFPPIWFNAVIAKDNLPMPRQYIFVYQNLGINYQERGMVFPITRPVTFVEGSGWKQMLTGVECHSSYKGIKHIHDTFD